MNKKLLAVAIAVVFSPAAMADVKIIGQAQTELVSISGDGATAGLYIADGAEGHSLNSGNAGALGFSVKHDLGGGLTGIAKVKFKIKVDENAAGLGVGRDSFVGLKGGFGTVIAGRFSSPYKSNTVKWDPFLGTSLQARGSAGMSQLHNGYTGGNTLGYKNKFGGVKVFAAFIIDESSDNKTPASTNGDNGVSLGINAPIGKSIGLALAYHDDGGTDTTAVKFGGTFKTGAIKVAAQMEKLGKGLAGKGDVKKGANMPGTDGVTIIYGNVSFKMSAANTVSAGFGTSSSDGSSDVGDATYGSVGMLHSFNKKVRGHVGFRSVTGKTASDESSVLVAGLRVKF